MAFRSPAITCSAGGRPPSATGALGARAVQVRMHRARVLGGVRARSSARGAGSRESRPARTGFSALHDAPSCGSCRKWVGWCGSSRMAAAHATAHTAGGRPSLTMDSILARRRAAGPGCGKQPSSAGPRPPRETGLSCRMRGSGCREWAAGEGRARRRALPHRHEGADGVPRQPRPRTQNSLPAGSARTTQETSP